MAALTDLLTKVGLPGTVTSLSSPGKAIGATSINIGSATNWPTSTAVFFAIRRVDPTLVTTANPSGTVPGTYTEWKGVVSGTTIAINPTPAYGTDQVYPAGTNTQVYVVISAARENALVDWGLNHADQLGALLPAAVQTAIQSIAANSIPLPKLSNTPSSNTDANGWLVVNYGNFRLATKTVSSASVKVRFEAGAQSSGNLPVGVATVGDLKSYWGTIEADSFSDFVSITRQNSVAGGTFLQFNYLFLGPTSATSYTVPVKFGCIF